jgi:hypothetical protein
MVSLLEALGRDLRVTLRSLRHRPGFTLVVVMSLALGIGANTAIFSLVDAILLRPLPVPHPHDLVVVDIAASRLTQFGDASYLDYRDFRSRSQSFESLAISQTMSAGMNTGQGDSQMVWGLLVSRSFFSTMQVAPVLGRDFRPEEDEVPGKYPVAIISYALWNKTFAKDPGVIGRQVKLNGQSFTIIGISPRSFSGADLFYRPDIYVPAVMTAGLTSDGPDMLTHRSYRGFSMMGRLKPGITVARAQAEMDTLMRDLERAYPDTNKDTAAFVRKEMNRRLVGNGILLPSILMGLVLLVLLIACANVASLLMARATSRIRDLYSAGDRGNAGQLGPPTADRERRAGTGGWYLRRFSGIRMHPGFRGSFAVLAGPIRSSISPGLAGPDFCPAGVDGRGFLMWTGARVLDGSRSDGGHNQRQGRSFRKPPVWTAGAASSHRGPDCSLHHPADWWRTVPQGFRQGPEG